MRKILLVCGVVVVLAVVFFYFSSDSGEIYEFSGDITRVENNSISVEGLFVGDTVPRGYSSLEQTEISLNITPDSTIKRVEIKIPEPIGEPFYPDEQPKKETSATIQNIEDDYAEHVIGVIAKFKRSSWNPFSFEIIDLEYRLLVR